MRLGVIAPTRGRYPTSSSHQLVKSLQLLSHLLTTKTRHLVLKSLPHLRVYCGYLVTAVVTWLPSRHCRVWLAHIRPFPRCPTPHLKIFQGLQPTLLCYQVLVGLPTRATSPLWILVGCPQLVCLWFTDPVGWIAARFHPVSDINLALQY